MRSKFYAELCEKYKRLGFDDIECYANEYLDKKEQLVEEESEGEDEQDEVDESNLGSNMAPSSAPSSSLGLEELASTPASFDCSSGYCGCAAAPA